MLEVLVVLALVALMLAIGGVNYNKFRRSQAAQGAGEMLAVALREQAAHATATQSECGLEIVSQKPFRFRNLAISADETVKTIDPSAELGFIVDLDSVSPELTQIKFPSRPWDPVPNTPIQLNLRCGGAGWRVTVANTGVVRSEAAP